MIRISVYDESQGDVLEFTQWWYNFTEHYEELDYDMNANYDITKTLLEWNALNVEQTEFIDFPSEEDATLFLLRWS